MTSITPTSETDSPSLWRALRRHRVTAAIVLLSLFVHGLQASALGLYWDDAGQLLQGLLAADHEPLAFILSDTGGSLRSERPLAYLAFGITRAAFLHGVAAVHWVLVALLTLNAIAIAGVARRLVDEDWFAFAAATVFLCYPLAPLQPLWPATVHYHVACLAALTSILCITRGLTGSVARRRWWSVVGFGVYAGSLATHEGFALVPPAFFVARWLCTLRPIADPGGRAHADERRPIAARLLGFAGVLALVAVWRVAFLPAYGLQLYPFRPERLAARVLLPKLWQGVVAAALPWPSAVSYLLRSRPAGPWLLAAGGAAAVVGVASVVLIRRAPRTPQVAAPPPARPTIIGGGAPSPPARPCSRPASSPSRCLPSRSSSCSAQTMGRGAISSRRPASRSLCPPCSPPCSASRRDVPTSRLGTSSCPPRSRASSSWGASSTSS